MQRERRITPAAGKEKPPAWKYLVRLLKPYCDEEVTKNMLVLLFEVKETNIEIIQRILALSDELRPNVKDIMLIYETYIQSDKCEQARLPWRVFDARDSRCHGVDKEEERGYEAEALLHSRYQQTDRWMAAQCYS